MARDEDDDDKFDGELNLPPKVEYFLLRYKAYAECSEEKLIDAIETELEKLEKEMTEDERTMAMTISRKIPINRDDDD